MKFLYCLQSASVRAIPGLTVISPSDSIGDLLILELLGRVLVVLSALAEAVLLNSIDAVGNTLLDLESEHSTSRNAHPLSR